MEELELTCHFTKGLFIFHKTYDISYIPLQINYTKQRTHKYQKYAFYLTKKGFSYSFNIIRKKIISHAWSWSKATIGAEIDFWEIVSVSRPQIFRYYPQFHK